MTTEKRQIIRGAGGRPNELPPREKIMVVGGEEEDEVGGDGAEGGDEAPDGEESGGSPEIAKLGVLADGALTPMTAELLALAHADGFSGMAAWRVCGKDPGTKSYRGRIVRSPLFGRRVEELVAEREKLEQGGIAGEALWAVKQNWRLARAGGVVMEIHRATVLLVEVTREQLGGAPPAVQEEGGETAAPRGPGRPPQQPRQLRFDIEDMKSKLVARGVPVHREGSA